ERNDNNHSQQDPGPTGATSSRNPGAQSSRNEGAASSESARVRVEHFLPTELPLFRPANGALIPLATISIGLGKQFIQDFQTLTSDTPVRTREEMIEKALTISVPPLSIGLDVYASEAGKGTSRLGT
ncbi:hypothetical protein, partial [Aurantimonas sp. C2-4-R8]|nr:hypothetical protein [Aurantimonas sp. C2-4-R8]